jgi:hypothetical protein
MELSLDADVTLAAPIVPVRLGSTSGR